MTRRANFGLVVLVHVRPACFKFPSSSPPTPMNELDRKPLPPAPLPLPLTPTTPVTPSSTSFPSPDAKPKKSNPLNDLIDTERTYVEQLTGVIRVSSSVATLRNEFSDLF
ncbi:hypothetical protein FPV67DRAFT_1465551 [Lyophyllum atratum]|nr:hypothetical protein FPV67DRAFT_1465551 [Lyophyllum atratum]